MPRSISLPFNALLVPAAPAEQRPYTSYRPMEELKEIFVRALSSPTAAELDPARSSGLSATEREQGERRWAELMAGKKRVISSCGSGMTACVVLWAMRMVAESEDVEWDKVKAALYDEVRSVGWSQIFDSVCRLTDDAPLAELDRIRASKGQRDHQGQPRRIRKRG